MVTILAKYYMRSKISINVDFDILTLTNDMITVSANETAITKEEILINFQGFIIYGTYIRRKTRNH